jgi:hypothetical protein
MSRVILDIETVGRDIGDFDEASRGYLLKWAKTEEDAREVEDSLSFYPLTGQIIAIGLLNPDTEKGALYYQAPGEEPVLPLEEDGIRYETGSEREILDKFWNAVRGFDSLVTFNGRGFDCPFILVRSAVYKLKPTKDLMPNRYDGSHIDLLDRLTFYGAVRRKFSLDMWCKTFGIQTPKAEFTGYEVKEIFRQGRYADIARYCARDLRATKELLSYWEKYIKA